MYPFRLENSHMFEQQPSLEFKRNVATKILLPVVAYFLAALITLLSPTAGLLLLASGPLIYFIPIDTGVWNLLVKPTDFVYRLLTGGE